MVVRIALVHHFSLDVGVRIEKLRRSPKGAPKKPVVTTVRPRKRLRGVSNFLSGKVEEEPESKYRGPGNPDAG